MEAPRLNPLQLLNTISVQSSARLMYVQVQVNGREVNAMIDLGVTHNFISQAEVQKFGIKLVESTNSLKVVNSKAKVVHGVGETTLQVGPW